MWRLAGPLAAVVWLLALIVFGLRLPGYSQWLHPVSLLGATGVPHATGFNVLGFMLPGMLAAFAALQLLQRMTAAAGRGQRIAGQLLLLAALAFTSMGLLPLDAGDIESRASQYHASLWMVWLVAFVAGSLLLAICSRKREQGGQRLALLAAACGTWVFVAAFGLEAVMPVALAQRLAFAGWMLWLLLSPQSSPAGARPGQGSVIG